MATITPENATNTDVTWSSSDETIATVSATGEVTAVKAGAAIITATSMSDKAKTATCAVTVHVLLVYLSFRAANSIIVMRVTIHPVLITADGTTTLLKPKKNQLAVGIFNDIAYCNEVITLKSGTALFCYTDGIVEAENTKEELYQEDRLLKTLLAHHVCGVKQLTEQVLESVAEHVLDAEQSDDLTILVIKYKEASKN